jgi:predicted nuclease of predicted toxin-antitoxin system
MKFLLDENVPPSLLTQLEKEGHEARHIIRMGWASTKDATILELAAETGEIILTHDLDFGTLLALSGNSKPSVIQFRLKRPRMEDMAAFLKEYLNELEEELSIGALITVDERLFKIRRLPIKR